MAGYWPQKSLNKHYPICANNENIQLPVANRNVWDAIILMADPYYMDIYLALCSTPDTTKHRDRSHHGITSDLHQIL